MKKTANALGRRDLLAGAAGLAALSLAPNLMLIAPAAARPAGEAASDKNRWGILIDLTKMDSPTCDVCVAACQAENGWHSEGGPTDTQWIRRVDLKDEASGRALSLPVMCQHCESPPCTDVCPTGASFRRADGIVLVDRHLCIGCRYCMMACPYKARSLTFDAVTDQMYNAPRGKGTVEACTMCVHRVDAGLEPACVEAANKVAPGAMTFGDLKDPDSALSKKVSEAAVTRIRRDLGLEPGVLYRGL